MIACVVECLSPGHVVRPLPRGSAPLRTDVVSADIYNNDFDYSSNATIYVLDVTDITDVKPLVTINPQEDIEMTSAFTGANSADVLLHATDDALELYVVNSGRSLIGKYKIVF